MIFSSDAVAKRTVAEKVVQRVKSGKCLCCESPSEVRGLCQRHYRNLMRKVSQMETKAARRQLIDEAVREGLVLNSWDVCAIRRDDPFASLGH